ncbi:hypothetical protein EYF80_063697 [Liparis tanakae]|uniref:Uncharacterized protein n=1 Tax=Liparis tanakae TaxID=230148 RepID=A0A4Z2EBA8_9TELE|nr:hypothetical protein EYF80_063697 [Liparis tanakae]
MFTVLVLLVSPVLDHHHVLLPTVPGTADVPHPAGLAGVVPVNEVLQGPLCIVDLDHKENRVRGKQHTCMFTVKCSQ